MSALSIEGERTNQSVYSPIQTGGKYFGTALAPQAVNPNINKYATVEYAAIAAIVLLAGYFIYKKVK